MSRPSPLAAQLAALGARMTEVCGVEVPEAFGDPAEEHRKVRAAGGIFDFSHRGLIQVSGPDRIPWFRGQCTNEVADLKPGQGNRTCIVTRLGKLVTDAVLSVAEQDLWLELNADRVPAALEHLEKYHIIEKVELADRTRDFGILGIHGPAAMRLLAMIGGQDVPDAPDYHFAEKHVVGMPVRVQRREVTGEVGFTVFLPAMAVGPALGMLTQFGQSLGVAPAGWAALQSLRIEAGEPFFGQDATEQYMPLETGLDATVSYTKGCYLGQEVIARVSTLGEASRALVGLSVSGDRVPRRDDPVVKDGQEAGKVTSAVRSPTLGRVIALAIVRKDFKAPGTALGVRPAGGGEAAPAEVVTLPFYRRGA